MGCHRTIRPLVVSAVTGAPQLEERYPGIKSRMTEAGKLQCGLAALVNDRSPNTGLQTTVGPEDEIYFAPAIAGGHGADEAAGSDVSSS